MRYLFLATLPTLVLLIAIGCASDDDGPGDLPEGDDVSDDDAAPDDDLDDDVDDDTGSDDDTAPTDCEEGQEYGEPPSIVRGPFLQQVTTSSIVIRWDTDRASNTVVRYGLEGGPRDRSWCDFAPTTHHEAAVYGLEAGRRYEYVVRSDGAQSEAYSFRAAAGPEESFSFVAYGDNQDHPEIHRAVAEGALAMEPDLFLNTGDIVSDGLVFEQYDERFFEPAFELLARTPFFVSIGNHEKQSPYYFDLLSLPGNEHWYGFTAGNARFLALDTNRLYLPGSPQYLWLEDELARARAEGAEWIIVFNHQPAWCEGWDHPDYDGDLLQRITLVPLYELYGVDLVLNGHAHDYERGTRNGVTYIIDGGGGGSLDSQQRDLGWITVYAAVHHFVHVEIVNRTAFVEARDIDGAVIDQFVLER